VVTNDEFDRRLEHLNATLSAMRDVIERIQDDEEMALPGCGPRSSSTGSSCYKDRTAAKVGASCVAGITVCLASTKQAWLSRSAAL
jgi:hypothetical protein